YFLPRRPAADQSGDHGAARGVRRRVRGAGPARQVGGGGNGRLAGCAAAVSTGPEPRELIHGLRHSTPPSHRSSALESLRRLCSVWFADGCREEGGHAEQTRTSAVTIRFTGGPGHDGKAVAPTPARHEPRTA